MKEAASHDIETIETKLYGAGLSLKPYLQNNGNCAFVGVAFIDSMENGGDGIKLHFTRAESARSLHEQRRKKKKKSRRHLLPRLYSNWIKRRNTTGTKISTVDMVSGIDISFSAQVGRERWQV